MHTEISVDPLPCGENLRAAFIGTSWQIDAATFRGRWDFEVRQDFEEIRYIISMARAYKADHKITKSISNQDSDWRGQMISSTLLMCVVARLESSVIL